METTMRKILILTAALTLILSIAAARADDTMVDNPAYQSWVKYKPGTLVKYSIESNSMGNVSTIVMMEVLKDVTPDNATVDLSMTMVVSGNKMDLPPTKREIPAKIKKADPAATQTADVPKIETARENIEAAGKTYSCTRTTTSSDASGLITESVVWTCDDVPGTMVKSDAKSTGPNLSISSKSILIDFQPQ